MNDLESFYQTAMSAHRAGRISDAEALCRQILDHDAHFARAWELLGIISQQQGDWERAVEYIEHAIRLEPRWPGFYHDLGTVLSSIHQYRAAEQALRVALSMMPQNVEVLTALARVL